MPVLNWNPAYNPLVAQGAYAEPLKQPYVVTVEGAPVTPSKELINAETVTDRLTQGIRDYNLFEATVISAILDRTSGCISNKVFDKIVCIGASWLEFYTYLLSQHGVDAQNIVPMNVNETMSIQKSAGKLTIGKGGQYPSMMKLLDGLVAHMVKYEKIAPLRLSNEAVYITEEAKIVKALDQYRPAWMMCAEENVNGEYRFEVVGGPIRFSIPAVILNPSNFETKLDHESLLEFTESDPRDLVSTIANLIGYNVLVTLDDGTKVNSDSNFKFDIELEATQSDVFSHIQFLKVNPQKSYQHKYQLSGDAKKGFFIHIGDKKYSLVNPYGTNSFSENAIRMAIIFYYATGQLIDLTDANELAFADMAWICVSNSIAAGCYTTDIIKSVNGPVTRRNIFVDEAVLALKNFNLDQALLLEWNNVQSVKLKVSKLIKILKKIYRACVMLDDQFLTSPQYLLLQALSNGLTPKKILSLAPIYEAVFDDTNNLLVTSYNISVNAPILYTFQGQSHLLMLRPVFSNIVLTKVNRQFVKVFTKGSNKQLLVKEKTLFNKDDKSIYSQSLIKEFQWMEASDEIDICLFGMLLQGVAASSGANGFVAAFEEAVKHMTYAKICVMVLKSWFCTSLALANTLNVDAAVVDKTRDSFKQGYVAATQLLTNNNRNPNAFGQFVQQFGFCDITYSENATEFDNLQKLFVQSFGSSYWPFKSNPYEGQKMISRGVIAYDSYKWDQATGQYKFVPYVIRKSKEEGVNEIVVQTSVMKTEWYGRNINHAMFSSTDVNGAKAYRVAFFLHSHHGNLGAEIQSYVDKYEDKVAGKALLDIKQDIPIKQEKTEEIHRQQMQEMTVQRIITDDTGLNTQAVAGLPSIIVPKN